jgi:NADH-quinone oxidoreductase subunit L
MDYSIQNVAPIVLLPFFAFVINAFIVKRATTAAVAISVLSIVGSFVYSLRIFLDFMNIYNTNYYVHKFFTWFDISFGEFPFKVDMGIYIDNMTAVMLLMVTGVASLIHIFSTWYMHDDARYGRFFVYLSLFTSAMLGLVLSDNLLSVFIFWEIMGFCSYSLIGFYYEKEKAGYASIKAFMTTRVGDVFFLLGIVALWTQIGSVSFVDIYAALAEGKLSVVAWAGIPLATFAGFCIFLGTIGKSAQFPLQVWLPDAMMGPTPCSALIHAATMVAAGVYLSLRMYPLMEAGHLTTFIAYIGAITAFGAATIALIQTDLKAVLAFSTISQLGYMVLGIGVGSYNAAFMHLITHAVFKACLFLSAGSIIHSIHEQEMPLLGGLKKKLPLTWLAMFCCTMAIIGMPLFSGFVSKDRILGDALIAALHHPTMWPVAILGFGGALLTTFYMCRMMYLIFAGQPRDHHLYDHCHKEHFGWNQNLPLLILSVFTLGVFYCGDLTGQGFAKVAGQKIEWFQTLIAKPKVENFVDYKKNHWSEKGVSEVSGLSASAYDSTYGLSAEEAHHVHLIHYIGAGLSVVIVIIGIFFAHMMYGSKKWDPAKWENSFKGWNKALKNKYYFDHLYIDVIIKKGLNNFNNMLAKFDMGIFDKYFVDGWEVVNRKMFTISKKFDNFVVDTLLVDGSGASVRLMNVVLRTVQSGKIQFYFIVIILVLASYIWSI